MNQDITTAQIYRHIDALQAETAAQFAQSQAEEEIAEQLLEGKNVAVNGTTYTKEDVIVEMFESDEATNALTQLLYARTIEEQQAAQTALENLRSKAAFGMAANLANEEIEQRVAGF